MDKNSNGYFQNYGRAFRHFFVGTMLTVSVGLQIHEHLRHDSSNSIETSQTIYSKPHTEKEDDHIHYESEAEYLKRKADIDTALARALQEIAKIKKEVSSSQKSQIK